MTMYFLHTHCSLEFKCTPPKCMTPHTVAYKKHEAKHMSASWLWYLPVGVYSNHKLEHIRDKRNIRW